MELNLKFENLVFSLPNNCAKGDEKVILKGISGEFRGSELSGILGPSGSGKSTLLNILSGFTNNSRISGDILVNDEEINRNKFKRKCAYILQEENLHQSLTIMESMKFSIKLKTGNVMTESQQNEKIFSILETLKLDKHADTFAKHLSGGQQKRLSIALELVDDPQVLFLDECTTGLDSVASTQCIQLLKKLAMEGRTIICTIHTPSALIFELFDYVYSLAGGQCLYHGSSDNLVPFLSSLDLVCPSTYNPADFLLEIANNDYGNLNFMLTEKISNGTNENFRKPSNNNNNIVSMRFKSSDETLNKSRSSFFYQFMLLMKRNFIISRRNATFLAQRLLISLIVGLLVGGLYINVGDEASQIYHNFKFIFVSAFFLLYISYYSQQTSFPLDLPIIRREVFNRWYSTSAYYVALSLSDIVMTILCSYIYLGVTYLMTNQPLDLDRAVPFFFINLLTSFTAQGFGLFASSIFDLQGTLTFAAIFLPLYGIFSGIFILIKDTHWLFHWIFSISFVKHSLDGGATAILGWNRPKMHCSENYCHYNIPRKFLQEIDLQDKNFSNSAQALIFFLLFFRVIAYFIMRYRLKNSN